PPSGDSLLNDHPLAHSMPGAGVVHHIIRVGSAREYVRSTLRAEVLPFVPSQLVRAVGLEPTLLLGNRFLKPARLPVPPRPHVAPRGIQARDLYQTSRSLTDCCPGSGADRCDPAWLGDELVPG